MQVRMEGPALRIERPEGPVERIPLGILSNVIVYGSPMVACDVWRALAERNIPAVLLPARGQGGAACLSAGLSNTLRLRRCQHRAASRTEERLAIARRLVSLKLQAQKRLIEYLASEARPVGGWTPPTLRASGTETLTRIIEHNLAGLAEAADIATLMGLEGTSAAAWWTWLAEVLPHRWRFVGRNRRPPRDPVNALLSLSYTLLGGEMLRQVQIDGLDPALGFLHGVVPGRESLVLDLIEPLRPSVDAFVLGLIDNRLTPRQFTFSRHDGCRLNKAGRELYYRAWAVQRMAWPKLLPLPEESSDAAVAGSEAPQPRTPEEAQTEPEASLSGQCRLVAGVLRALLDETELEGDPING